MRALLYLNLDQNFYLLAFGDNHGLLSVPTRRSSDLGSDREIGQARRRLHDRPDRGVRRGRHGTERGLERGQRDRKSTRLNSSHVESSYAVFRLKKKIHHRRQPPEPDFSQSARTPRRDACAPLSESRSEFLSSSLRGQPRSPVCPYTTLFRSRQRSRDRPGSPASS